MSTRSTRTIKALRGTGCQMGRERLADVFTDFKDDREVHVFATRVSYTLKEAAKVTGIGQKTLLAAIHGKALRAVRVGARGGKWIVTHASLVEWLEGEATNGG